MGLRRFGSGRSLAALKLIAAGGHKTYASIFSPVVHYPVDVRKDLLLIYNTNSVDSAVVKDYYLAHRPMVTGANVLGITCTTNETFLTNEYATVFAPQIQNWLSLNPTKRPQYVILFPTIPSRVNWYSNEPPNMYWITGRTASVQYRLHTFTPGWRPFVASINMGGTNDCRAYIDKLKDFGATNQPGQLLISARRSGYGNVNYVFDSKIPGGLTPAYRALVGATNAGVPLANVLYEATPHIVGTATNVAGYLCHGQHAEMGGDYARNGMVKFAGDSRWYIIETIESFNGQRLQEEQGTFIDWFSVGAFGGGNYSHTPVGAVTHVDEPGGAANDAYYYFNLWARGKNFGMCAWQSRRTPYFQAVGDPFVQW